MNGGIKAQATQVVSMSKSLGQADSSTHSGGKDSSVECPECGRDDFADRRAMGIHRSAAHGRAKIQCENCGGTFETKHSNKDIKKYCSRNCEREHKTEEHTCEWCGEKYTTKKSRSEKTRFCSNECKLKNHSIESRDRVTISCGGCGVDFEVVKSREDTAKYCSKKCSGRRETLSCEYCASNYTVVKAIAERGSRFCSRDCKNDWQSENNVGENHPLFNGGYGRYYGSNWRRMRRKTRERDGFQCQSCGLHQSESRWKLSVHHITPLRNFDKPEDANTLANLVTLCRSCHSRWEGIPLRPQVK